MDQQPLVGDFFTVLRVTLVGTPIFGFPGAFLVTVALALPGGMNWGGSILLACRL